jgi:deoxyribodipyrimidine photo-lyase
MKNRAILWFRQDLRTHDNESLSAALKTASEVIPVYVFDERVFLGKTRQFGFPKTGAPRAQFYLEAVADLRNSLRKLGSDLIIRVGKPEEIVANLATELKASWVFCNRERMQEELAVQEKLEHNLWQTGIEIVFSRGKMLFYTQDLPFPIAQTPDIFSQFRKETERLVNVRRPLLAPEKMGGFSAEIDRGELPTMTELGHADFQKDTRSALDFVGGETAGIARVRHYFEESGAVKTYKETRNGLLGADYSTKFSPWLAAGCLSPKYIYYELKAFEASRGANESTYWVFFELLWRDFFRLLGKKFGNKIFQKNGTIGLKNSPKWSEDLTCFQIWADGRTGIPFIDANMRELENSGWMSNRGRQNVASFLVKDLKINWQMGAEWFESTLIDYDVCSNWGNWNYVAGVGNDPREDRYFNILKQAKTHDPKGEFVKHWIPELENLAADRIHRPDLLTAGEAQKIGLGSKYPKPMFRMDRWERNG